ncbi:hypothetical protein CJ184_006220 [Actinotignum urinale]|nr:hypothetical protein [Actinotignum urinale]WIK58841.1 hypothetical protein CJ184_006220 [Actinotignum urinale]
MEEMSIMKYIASEEVKGAVVGLDESEKVLDIACKATVQSFPSTLSPHSSYKKTSKYYPKMINLRYTTIKRSYKVRTRR